MSEEMKRRAAEAKASLVRIAKKQLRDLGGPDCEALTRALAEAQAEVERLRAERNGAITSAANAEADAAAARRSLRTALVERDQTFKAMHARATAAEAERDEARTEAAAARAMLLAISEMIDNATQAPQTVDRWLDRIEDVCRAAAARAALAETAPADD